MISIVTVCLNAEDTICNTMDSVLAQTYQEIEYIVLDGSSTDRTIEYLKLYEKKFFDKGIRYIWKSEKDSGVYDAMNRALEVCTGDFVQYLNADDTFYNETALEAIFSEMISDDVGILYGDALRVEHDKKLICHAKDIKDIVKYMTFNHQAAFVRLEKMKKYKFDLQYRIAADYDLFLRMYLNNEKFLHRPVVISNYSAMGLSNMDFYKTHLEYREIWHENKIVDKNSFKMRLKTKYHWLKGQLRHKKVFNGFYYWLEKKGNRL